MKDLFQTDRLIFKMMTGSVWPSAFVGAAFALHPLHVESVAWAAERKDVLSTFFWLLTMWAYVRYTERKGIGRFLLALLFFGLGLMSKAMLVTLPFVLLLLDYWPLDRFRDIKKLVLEKVPFFLVMVLSSVATFFAQRGSGAIESFGTLTLKVRVANAAISYIRYIGKTFWPSRLSVFYPHLRYHLPIWQAAVSALLLVGITICVVLMLRRKRWLTVGWLWYVGTLVPVIGLVQIGAQSIADRYMYVPIIGLFVIVGWSVPDIITKRRYGRIGLGLLTGIVFLVLILCTHSQVKHWKNSHALFTHALAVTDNNIIAHQQLGGIYSKQKKYEEAIVHYEAALEILPNYPKTHNNLAIALTKLGRLDEAIMHYRKLLEHHKDNAVIHNTVASLLTQRGQFDEAIKHFKEAVRLDPQKLSYRMNLETARMRQRKVKQR